MGALYKRNAQGWSKHFDFIILDLISQHIAFLSACLLRMGEVPYALALYRNLAVILALIDVIVLVLMNSLHNVLKRGYLKEMKATVLHCFVVFSVVSLVRYWMHRQIERRSKASPSLRRWIMLPSTFRKNGLIQCSSIVRPQILASRS